MAKSLKLQSQQMGKPQTASEKAIAKVLVRTGIFHLDQPFDYLIPQHLSNFVRVGSRVSVSFRGKKCEGFVIERTDTKIAGVKLQMIEKFIANQFDDEYLSLINAWSQRWAANPLDLIRFSAPDPVLRAKPVQTSTKIHETALPKALSTKHARMYWQLPPLIDEAEAAFQLINTRLQNGRVLVIFPEERILERVEKRLAEFEIFPAVISSEMSKSERYANFLAVQNGAKLTIGTRSAAMMPGEFTTTIVWREDSEHHFEIHSPGWNSRDASLIRSTTANSSLIFAGYVPSVETERLIETGFLTVCASSGKVRAFAATANQNEILPSSVFKKVKSALRLGPVLLVVPTKGYGTAISCNKCRNVAKCSCGGKLTKYSKTSNPSCVICNRDFANWHCSFCNSEAIRIIGRGIERIHEEIGKSFPGIRIFTSTAERELSRRVFSNSIVLATPGMAANQFFQLTVILDGHSSFRDLRAEERYFNTLFRYGALAETEIAVIGDEVGAEVSALTQWSAVSLVKRLNRERNEAAMPPYVRTIVLTANTGIERIASGIQNAIDEKRLPNSTRIFTSDKQIIIFASIADMPEVTKFIYEFQKKRSMSGKELIKYRIDPYSLG